MSKIKKLLSVLLAVVMVFGIVGTTSFAADGDLVANIAISTSKSKPAQGDTITVTVKLTTNYNISAANIPVLYDANFFTLVGSGSTAVSNISSTLLGYCTSTVNTASPARFYPSSYTADLKAQWKFVYVQFTAQPGNGYSACTLNDETLFTFQLTVNSAATKNVETLIKIDPAFQKTSSYTGGKLAIGSWPDNASSFDGLTAVSVGQTINSQNASVTVGDALDLTALQTAVDNTPAHPQNYYTDGTWSTYSSKLTDAQAILKDSSTCTQEDVDAAKNALVSAFNALALLDADYDAVNEIIETVPEDLTLYTEKTAGDLEAIIKGINWELKIDEQKKVDDYVQAISNAIADLQYRNADYDAVNKAIAKKPADFDSGNYTDDSVKAVNDAIDAVVPDLTIIDQDDVDDFAAAIEKAISELKYKDADYKVVNDAIAKKPADFDSGDYTDDSVKAVNDAIAAVVSNLTILDQDDVDDFAAAIEKAISELEYKKADYSKVDEALGKVPVNTSIYTDDSVEALEKATKNLDLKLNIKNQKTVDGYAEAIELALKGLTLKDASYEELDRVLGTIPSDLTLYTDDSVKALQDLTKTIDRTLKIVDQDDLDELTDKISDAITNLKFKPADITSLEKAYNRVPEKLDYYTDESVKALNDALEASKDYKNNSSNYDIRNNEEIKNAANDIDKAIDGLVYSDSSVISVESSDKLIGGQTADLVIKTKDNVKKLQIIIGNDTWTYIPSSKAVKSVVDNGDNTMTWTITFTMYKNAMFLTVHAKTDLGWESKGKYFDINCATDGVFCAKSFTVDKSQVLTEESFTITVTTTTDVYKIALRNSVTGLTTIISAYTDDGDVRTFTYTKSFKNVCTIDYTLRIKGTIRDKDWKDSGFDKVTVNVIERMPSEDAGVVSAEVSKSAYISNENVVITVKTDTNISKIALIDKNGNSFKTVSTGYTDNEGVRTWVIEKSFPTGKYEFSIATKLKFTWETSAKKVAFDVYY